MMSNGQQTILLVSDNAACCAAVRRELEAKHKELRVAAVSTGDAARRIVLDAVPAVILLEDSSVGAPGGAAPHAAAEHASPLESVVSDLTASAPVVVIGGVNQETELTALVASGLVDFVRREAGCLPTALGLIERRLRQAYRPPCGGPKAASVQDAAVEGFGEVFRHELNNPLTGIVGNAELLLAELRRKNDGRLPNGGQQRLETIAALAVRLRETVRRLSQDWEPRNRPGRQTPLRPGIAHHGSAH